MKTITYLAVFEKSRTGFGVYFPDVPGCITCGDNFDHALAMAREALDFHLEDTPPPPRTDNIPPLAEGDLVVPVTVFPALIKTNAENRREKTTVTLPRYLKKAAEAEGLNYSRLLECAIKETLGILV
jgi:predicted RNase H-like HicB family nuclease